MASTLRPTLLRHALQRRTFTTSTSSAMRSHFPKPAVLGLQRAAFQTSTPRSILPPLPQTMAGDVNQAASVPHPEPSHGSYHWTAERLVSAALLPMTIAPFAAGSLNPMLDGIFVGLILVHSHIGFDSVITDYLPKWRVPKARRFFDWARNLALVVVGWGWYEFETNDVGLTEAVRRIWRA